MAQVTVTTITSANGSTDLTLKTGNTSGASLVFGANGVLVLNASTTSANSQTYGTTSNATVNSTIIQIANTTSQANLTSGSLALGANVSLGTTGLVVGNVTTNSILVTVGANVGINPTSIFVGNSTVNASITSTGIFINGTPKVFGPVISANNSDNQTYYIPVSNNTSGAWTNAVVDTSGVTYNPSTQVLQIGNSSVYTQITNLGITMNNALALYTCGYNAHGELGIGGTTSQGSPTGVYGSGTNWTQVACGYSHTAAIKSDGTLCTCGYNNVGQLGNGTTTSNQYLTQTAGGGKNWTQVAGNQNFMTAIKTDGTLWTWGDNSYGKLGDGTTSNRSSPVTTAGGGNTWSSLGSGYNHTAAIKTDGTLWTWGYDSYGQLGDGTTTARSSPGTVAGGGTTWAQVSCGSAHTAAIKTDGTLWTWGWDNYGQLGNGTTTSRSSPGTVAGGGTTWAQVSCGQYHTAAIKTDGTLWTWGQNFYGKLGDGTTTLRSSPGTTAGGGTTWSQVACGKNHTVALKTNGTLWTWGVDQFGQLGDQSTTARSSPGTTAGGGTTWKKIAAGQSTTGAIQQQSSRQL